MHLINATFFPTKLLRGFSPNNGYCEEQGQWAERRSAVRTSTQDLPFQYAPFFNTNIPTISCYYKDYGYLICKQISSH